MVCVEMLGKPFLIGIRNKRIETYLNMPLKSILRYAGETFFKNMRNYGGNK